MEEAANRADIRGNKGFADHSNLSYFQGYHRGAISAKQRAMLDRNFDKVFRKGSDVSKVPSIIHRKGCRGFTSTVVRAASTAIRV